MASTGAIDAGIMIDHLQSAAEALGYGTTCLGSVRNSMEEFITLFNLPKKTLLLVGTTIGVPTEKAKNAPLKPRVALDSFVMEDTYDSDKVRSSALTYEKEFKEFCRIKKIPQNIRGYIFSKNISLDFIKQSLYSKR